MCPVFCNTRNGLIKHLFKKHRNEPNFIVHSASEGCGASFRTDDSFRMHCSRKHLAEELNNTNGTVEDDAMRESMDTQYEGITKGNVKVYLVVLHLTCKHSTCNEKLNWN
jgi:hypothetical protein